MPRYRKQVVVEEPFDGKRIRLMLLWKSETGEESTRARVEVEPGEVLPWHLHLEEWEQITLISGDAYEISGDDGAKQVGERPWRLMKPGETVLMEAGCPHTFAAGDEKVIFDVTFQGKGDREIVGLGADFAGPTEQEKVAATRPEFE